MSKNLTDAEPLVLMVLIVDRGKGEKVAETFGQNGTTFNVLVLGRGTAEKKILSYLGIGEREKEVLYSAMPNNVAQVILEKLNDEQYLKKPGKGIAFTILINGIADPISQSRLRGSVQKQGGVVSVEQPLTHNLIIAVTNQGYADEVMDAAKPAGAKGGTILHARGAGLEHAEKFFGISIQPEKEMVLILAEKETSRSIMTAISEKQGLQTDAKTLVFSIPVNGVAGLTPESGFMETSAKKPRG